MQHLPEITRFVDARLPGTLAGLRVLDLGCGIGWGASLVRLHEGGLDAQLTGVDVWDGYLARARDLGLYDELMKVDLERELPNLLQYDVVLALEILEHLSQDRGRTLLDAFDACPGLSALISVPNGDQRRRPVYGVQSEAHLSRWTARDFRRRGYATVGIGLRGLRADSRLGTLGIYLGTPFTLRMPVLACNLVCSRARSG